MPPLLSCLLGKRLCEDVDKEDHWALRDRCAVIISDICRKFGNTYTNLIPRVARTMVKVLQDTAKPLPCHYGAIVGLASFGAHTIDTLLIPKLEEYLNVLESATNVMSDHEAPLQLEVQKVRSALKGAASKWLAGCVEVSEERKQFVRGLFPSESE